MPVQARRIKARIKWLQVRSRGLASEPFERLRGISLANKCLLMFGGAVVLIVIAALAAPWVRMNALAADARLERSRLLADVWQRLDADRPPGTFDAKPLAGIQARRVSPDAARQLAVGDPDLARTLARALRALERSGSKADWQGTFRRDGQRTTLYARAVRRAVRNGTEAAGGAESERVLSAIVLLERPAEPSGLLVLINTVYLASAGSTVLGLALLVFYLITHKIILSPVRELRETAERVRAGDWSTRSTIATGDEFEELADTFNQMVTDLEGSHDTLRANYAALDLKVDELSKANVALYETAKIKGEFVANVSHELRTPLNSIIGFAELLLEVAQNERRVVAERGETPGGDVDKRTRYLENIVTAGRNLLEMIEALLEMAKLEAGRVHLNVDRMALRDACEGLMGLIYPLAARRGIQLRLEVASDVPLIETDAKKFQQIIFNFLSNAVKFTAKGGSDQPEITLRAERLTPSPDDPVERVRVSVIDNGPGIPPEQQARIFDKFEQIDPALHREHTGAGLGLAICRELAGIVQAEIQLVSDLGRGSMFSLILPVTLDHDAARERELETAFRGVLSGRREWDANGSESGESA